MEKPVPSDFRRARILRISSTFTFLIAGPNARNRPRRNRAPVTTTRNGAWLQVIHSLSIYAREAEETTTVFEKGDAEKKRA